MWYAVGKPGDAVRQYILEPSLESAQLQCKPNEVALSVGDQVPQGGVSSIALDGKSIAFDPFDSDYLIEQAWAQIRLQRDAELDQYRWTWSVDSPLSEACRANWLAWAQTLHRITVDYSTPESVVWPDQPSYEY